MAEVPYAGLKHPSRVRAFYASYLVHGVERVNNVGCKFTIALTSTRRFSTFAQSMCSSAQKSAMPCSLVYDEPTTFIIRIEDFALIPSGIRLLQHESTYLPNYTA